MRSSWQARRTTPVTRGEASLRRLCLASCLGLGTLVVACGSSVAPGSFKGHRPEPAREVGALSLPDVAPGRSARTFHFAARAGDALIVYFGFVNCPDACPTVLRDVRSALKTLGSDASRVEVAFVTVDLERDLPAVIAPYLASFVTGGHALRADSTAQLNRVERGFGAASSAVRDAGGELQVGHTSFTYLVDEHGRVVVEWPFGTSPADFAHDLRLAIHSQPAARP
jgi:protein SCO1/2